MSQLSIWITVHPWSTEGGKQKRAAQSPGTEIFVGQYAANSGEDPLTVANNYRAGNINLCGKITRRKSGWCTRGTPACLSRTGVYIACTRCIDVARCCNLRFVVAGETRSFSRLWFRRKRRFRSRLTLAEITASTYRMFRFHHVNRWVLPWISQRPLVLIIVLSIITGKCKFDKKYVYYIWYTGEHDKPTILDLLLDENHLVKLNN